MFRCFWTDFQKRKGHTNNYRYNWHKFFYFSTSTSESTKQTKPRKKKSDYTDDVERRKRTVFVGNVPNEAEKKVSGSLYHKTDGEGIGNDEREVIKCNRIPWYKEHRQRPVSDIVGVTLILWCVSLPISVPYILAYKPISLSQMVYGQIRDIVTGIIPTYFHSFSGSQATLQTVWFHRNHPLPFCCKY